MIRPHAAVRNRPIGILTPMSKPPKPSSDAGQPGPDDTSVSAQQDGALGSFGVPPDDPLGTRADGTPYAEAQPGGVPAPAAKRTPAQAMAAAAAESTAMLGTPPSQPPRAQGGAPAVQAVTPMVPSSQATPQTRRRGLIPSWVPWAAGGTVLAILLIVLVTLLVVRGNIVRVPSVQGLTGKAAQTRLQEAGLKMVVSDQLFSATVAAGSVVSQQPRPGTTLNVASLPNTFSGMSWASSWGRPSRSSRQRVSPSSWRRRRLNRTRAR